MQDHYAQVAKQAADQAERAAKQVTEQTTEQTAKQAADQAERAEQGCSCCEPIAQGEAAKLYDPAVLEGLPIATLAASRGCGDPVAQARLQPGEVVVDLGSGGGIDALIASRLVGSEGRVYGLDMTPEMVQLARENARAAGIDNVEFIEGSIDDIPLPEGCADVVLSNCVINFCEDKRAVFAEALRVLAPGGRIVVSDIVSFAPIPPFAYETLCAITGCRRGISSADDYRALLEDCGYEEISIAPKTLYTDEVLAEKAQRKGLENKLKTVLAESAGTIGSGASGDATSGSAISATTGSAIVSARNPRV